MSEKPQRIVVESTTRGWTFAGAVLIGAAIGLGAYGLQIQGLGEVAATGSTFFAFTFAKSIGASLWSATNGGHFARVGELIRALNQDYQAWLIARPVPAKMVIALGLTIVFLIVRWAMAGAISMLANWVIAGAVGCALGAAIAAPTLFTALGRKLQSGQQAQESSTDNAEPN